MIKPAGYVKTTWELRTYDVWGNPKHGYEVNNTFDSGTVELRIPKTRYNARSALEFTGAYPSMKQIRKLFGVRCLLCLDGDDTHIYVSRARDGYPLGEMHCISHKSLSPICPEL